MSGGHVDEGRLRCPSCGKSPEPIFEGTKEIGMRWDCECPILRLAAPLSASEAQGPNISDVNNEWNKRALPPEEKEAQPPCNSCGQSWKCEHGHCPQWICDDPCPECKPVPPEEKEAQPPAPRDAQGDAYAMLDALQRQWLSTADEVESPRLSEHWRLAARLAARQLEPTLAALRARAAAPDNEELLEKIRAQFERGYSMHSSHGCPMCVYKEGEFIKACAAHRDEGMRAAAPEGLREAAEIVMTMGKAGYSWGDLYDAIVRRAALAASVEMSK